MNKMIFKAIGISMVCLACVSCQSWKYKWIQFPIVLRSPIDFSAFKSAEQGGPTPTPQVAATTPPAAEQATPTAGQVNPTAEQANPTAGQVNPPAAPTRQVVATTTQEAAKSKPKKKAKIKAKIKAKKGSGGSSGKPKSQQNTKKEPLDMSVFF